MAAASIRILSDVQVFEIRRADLDIMPSVEFKVFYKEAREMLKEAGVKELTAGWPDGRLT